MLSIEFDMSSPSLYAASMRVDTAPSACVISVLLSPHRQDITHDPSVQGTSGVQGALLFFKIFE